MAEPAAAARKHGETGTRAAPTLRGVRGQGARAAAAELDALIHHRLRLGMLSALAARESCTFNELKALLGTTDGNLSVHARKLEEAHYVLCTKTFAERRPRTEYRLAPAGRQALERYLNHMEALIRATRPTLTR